jgi:hypothetical protein
VIAHARTSDPETSHEAAASVGEVRLSQTYVYTVLSHAGPSTDEELVRRYAASPHPMQSPSGIRSRRAELARLGMVEFTGEKRRMSTGRLARVWRAVPF